MRIKLPKVALQFLQQELTKLETFIDNEVLLGISLQSLSISCKIKNAIDDGDLETDGCGLFLPEATPSLDTIDSRKFL